MPKSVLILFAAAVLVVAIPACGNNGGSGNVAPAPSVSLTPNPKITDATVKVTVLGTPKAFSAVQISTPKSSASPRPGTPFQTLHTHKNGQAKFQNLKPSVTYCWVATLGPNGQTSSACASWLIWQYQPISLGT